MKKNKTRGNSRYFIVFFVLLSSLGVLGYYSFQYLKSLSFLNIKTVEIRGNINLDRNFLESLAQEFIGRNIFEVSNREITEKYQLLVRVKSLRIRRIIPNRLSIHITENRGVFYIKSDKGFLYPIDERGLILDNVNFYLKEDLPIVHTDKKDELFEPGSFLEDYFIDRVFRVHNKFKENNLESLISEYYALGNDIAAVEMYTGSLFIVSEENLEHNLPRLRFYINNRRLEQRAQINLKFTNQLIISEVK